MAGTGGDIQKTAALIQQFANNAPSDIRAAFQVVASDYTKIASALKGVNLTSGQAPSTSVLAKLSQLSSQLNTAKLTAAGQQISAWAKANCGTG